MIYLNVDIECRDCIYLLFFYLFVLFCLVLCFERVLSCCLLCFECVLSFGSVFRMWNVV